MTGVLFVADLLIEGMEVVAGNYFDTLWKGGGYYFQSTLDEITGVVVVSLWFITLFRYLADARPTWKATIIGGVLTGVLFSGGKLLLHFLLVNSNISSLYGASGSIVLILLFVFYSSFILYYGASFIYVFSTKSRLGLKPVNNAFSYTIEEVEKEKEEKE
jgi:membrane protein